MGLLLLGLLLAGCGEPRLVDETYGRRRGTPGQSSVNGTAVLARMFTEAGHRVLTARRLSPRLDRMDAIVWVPDDFEPPSREALAYLDSWLEAAPERTLIYVGRDFDAAPVYWRAILPAASAGQALEIKRRLAMSQSDHDAARQAIPAEYHGQWFSLARLDPQREVHWLRGPLGEGIDASRTMIRLRARMELPRQADEDGEGSEFVDWIEAAPLLESDEGLLVGRVSRPQWDGSQVIVVANGSFLLNLPLINHQHRQLAGRLVQQCGRSGQNVAFLESGPDGVSVSERDAEMHHLVRAFTQWPINCILLHLTMLGIVYCIFAFPIFGRPRDSRSDSQSDFGNHIDALGGLLERTADRAYAQARLAHYLQTVRRDPQATPFRPQQSDATSANMPRSEASRTSESTTPSNSPPASHHE